MNREQDKLYMQRCLELAEKGLGNTYPNPLVGSVIVHKGRIIGEGYHRKAGESHAEVIAIESVKDKALLKESVLYVNLEPCSHFGRTPPCAARIVREGIPRVVVGTVDTSSKVSGSGIKRLLESGCDVVTGVCESEARVLNKRFFTFHEKKRPFIILKWAMSADGFMDVVRPPGSPVEPYWITGISERVLVHRWRASEQVILAGGGTIRSDNPSLNVRYWHGKNPVKAIISLSGTMDAGSKIFMGGERVHLLTAGSGISYPNTDVEVISGAKEDVIGEVLDYLYRQGFQSVFVEGGKTVHEMFLMAELWDEARIFMGDKSWESGVPAPVIKGKGISLTHFPGSDLKIITNDYVH